ncbi:MAG: hypothetical protein ABFD54_11540 [Armatimonadota bacterium]
MITDGSARKIKGILLQLCFISVFVYFSSAMSSIARYISPSIGAVLEQALYFPAKPLIDGITAMIAPMDSIPQQQLVLHIVWGTIGLIIGTLIMHKFNRRHYADTEQSAIVIHNIKVLRSRLVASAILTWAIVSCILWILEGIGFLYSNPGPANVAQICDVHLPQDCILQYSLYIGGLQSRFMFVVLSCNEAQAKELVDDLDEYQQHVEDHTCSFLQTGVVDGLIWWQPDPKGKSFNLTTDGVHCTYVNAATANGCNTVNIYIAVEL